MLNNQMVSVQSASVHPEAWHTSVVWVRAEAQSALIRSTIATAFKCRKGTGD